MMKSALAIALILCLPAVARGDRPKVSSDGRVQGLFCSSPNGFGDCVAACAAQYKSIDPARTCGDLPEAVSLLTFREQGTALRVLGRYRSI
jgi:hypothetical protein